MPSLPITFDMGPLEEGWEGTANDLLQKVAELLTGEVEGDFPVGQLGGSRPTEDVGVWYDTANREIEMWNGTKYLPIANVPVGALIDWGAADSVPAPANYLDGDGSLLSRAEYPELYDAYRTSWGTPPNSDTFYIPNTCGRVPVGSGVGKYVPDGSGLSGPGNMREVELGQYFGSESIQSVEKQAGGPSTLKQILNMSTNLIPSRKNITSSLQPSYGVRKIIRYR